MRQYTPLPIFYIRIIKKFRIINFCRLSRPKEKFLFSFRKYESIIEPFSKNTLEITLL